MDGTFFFTAAENIQKYIQLQKHLFFIQSLNSSLGFHYFYRDFYFLHTCEPHHLQNNCPHKLITLMSGKEKNTWNTQNKKILLHRDPYYY